MPWWRLPGDRPTPFAVYVSQYLCSEGSYTILGSSVVCSQEEFVGPSTTASEPCSGATSPVRVRGVYARNDVLVGGLFSAQAPACAVLSFWTRTSSPGPSGGGTKAGLYAKLQDEVPREKSSTGVLSYLITSTRHSALAIAASTANPRISELWDISEVEAQSTGERANASTTWHQHSAHYLTLLSQAEKQSKKEKRKTDDIGGCQKTNFWQV